LIIPMGIPDFRPKDLSYSLISPDQFPGAHPAPSCVRDYSGKYILAGLQGM
jgi:hypothetical protein